MPQVSRRTLLQSTLALSLMPRTFFGQEPMLPRQRLLLDFDWRFFAGNANDPRRDLGFGSGQGDFSKSGSFGFAQATFDDSKWAPIHLPHDWAVELPFVHDGALEGHGYKPLGRNYPETSIGWYRKTFSLPPGSAGKRFTIDFDGAFRSALIFVNGYFIGRNENGYAPFSFDLTDYLSATGPNVLVVRMDASFGDGWFYEGAGIYRHVWLNINDAIHIPQWETVVRTEVKGNVATLSLTTAVMNASSFSADAHIHWTILDSAGKLLASAESPVQSIGPSGQNTFTASTRLTAPSLWSPESPTLYTAIATVVSGGRTLDAEQVTFGVRTIRFDKDHGFFLNDKSVKIKGTCNHQDHAGVGAALPDRLQIYRLAILKDMGGNAVRTSHNMPTPEWVEACDRLGMMMMCETRNEASTPEGLDQLSVMIRRYRNSPSIILWSIGNEEWELQKGELGEHVAATMVARAHQLDPTRKCTAAINGAFDTGTSRSLDVEGINYNLWAVDKYHKDHPAQPMIGSETGSTVSTRGVYATDKLRNQVSAYDLNAPPWAETAETWWKYYATREYLAGGFAWTGFDYRGEPTPYSWPSINSQFGIVDMCGFPKDNFFYYKAWWSAEPVLHLFPHWNWQERLGEQVSVWVHSNLDSVELFLNGKSLGSQPVVALTHLEWKVRYEPGVIEARGTKSGKVVLTERHETTGTIANLRLTPDRNTISADGEDLVIYRVEALDEQGRSIPTADDLIQFKVVGAGTLIGVGNGDPNCQESDKESKRSLFMGLAQVILQSTREPGQLTLEAFTEDFPGPKLPSAKSTITTQRVKLRPRL